MTRFKKFFIFILTIFLSFALFGCGEDEENQNGNEVEVDARPSDAIAIAIRANVPIYVSASVMADGAITTDSQKDEEEATEFKNFIKDIKPSDFAKLVDKNFESDQ